MSTWTLALEWRKQNKTEKCDKFDAVCIFYQGPGLLLSDDDTAFNGEFSDDWTVSGKVEDNCVLQLCDCPALYFHNQIII